MPYRETTGALLRRLLKGNSGHNQPKGGDYAAETHNQADVRQERSDGEDPHLAALNAHIEAFLHQHQTHHAENSADGQKSLSLTQRSLTWSKIATCLSFVAAMGTVGSAVFALLQLREARDEQRPWIILSEVKPDSLTTDDEAGVNFWVTLKVKNVGHSPAQDVFVSGALVLNEFSLFPDRDVRRVCNEAHRWYPSGNVFFPDQPAQGIWGDTPENFSIDVSNVKAARERRIASAISVLQGKRQREEEAGELSIYPFWDSIMFVGCINYRVSPNSELYQTSFIYDLGSFPLLGGVQPKDAAPTPIPGSPGAIMVHPRFMQRYFPGTVIKPSQPLYGTFAR